MTNDHYCRPRGFAVGKEGNARQRAPGKETLGKGSFAERLLSGTRQSLCRAPRAAFGKEKQRVVTVCTVTPSLLSASSLALGKAQNIFSEILFADSSKTTLGKEETNFFLKISLPSASNNALGKEEKFVFF